MRLEERRYRFDDREVAKILLDRLRRERDETL